MPDTGSDVLTGTGTGASIGTAIFPGIGTAIGAGIGALGGLVAGLFGQQDYTNAANTVGEGLTGFQNVNTNVGYQDVSGIPQSSYDTASQQGNNALGDALSQLQAKYNQGGMNATDISQTASILGAQEQGAAQARAAVQNEAQARGQSNSGLNYVSQLVGGQQAAGQSLQAAQSQAAIAEQAKMAESGQIAGIGNQLQQNAYQVAGANDAIAQFNKGLQVSNSQNTTSAQTASINAGLQKAGGLANVYANQGSILAGKGLANTQSIGGVGYSLSGLPSAIQAAGAPSYNQAVGANNAMDVSEAPAQDNSVLSATSNWPS